MTDPTIDFPQPPRDPFPPAEFHPDERVAVTPASGPTEPEEPSEAYQETRERPVASDAPAKLGITAVRQLDERVDVMLQRIHAFRVFLAKYGVDENTVSPSLIKRELVQALNSIAYAEESLVHVKGHTKQARETLESL